MAESDGASGWDKLKKTPATIVVDGLSINDYLSLIRDQVNSLHTSQKQQQNLIQNLTKELENERLKNNEMNQKFQELNNRIQTLEKTDSNEILKTLSQHENEIKELVSRPIVDLSEAIRLSIVEKKLASFYGDDINILGRVAHLENLHETDKENTDKLLKSLHDSNTTLDTHQTDLNSLQQTLQNIKDSLTTLQTEKLDESQLHSLLKQHPSATDFESLKDLLNTLANDNQEELSRLHQQEILPLITQNKQQQELIDELIQKANAPVMMCYGNDQSARLSSLESRQLSLEMLPQSLEDLRQRLLSIEEQSRQVMKTTLNESLERNKLSGFCSQLEANQLTQKELLEGSFTRECNVLDKKINGIVNQLEREGLNWKEIGKFIEEKLEKRIKQKEQEDQEAVATAIAVALGRQAMSQANANASAHPSAAAAGDVELLKEFCQELEKRVFLLANECRDGLEFVQNTQDKKIEILTKWILKHASGVGTGTGTGKETGGGDGTDIGVKCLACNAPSSHVNQKTTVGGGFSFGASERFGGHRNVSPGKGGGGGGETAPFRVTVPESLRSLISRSRSAGTAGTPLPPTPASGPGPGPTSATQRLYGNGNGNDREEDLDYDLDLNEEDVSYEDIQRGRTIGGSRAGGGSQPNWKNSQFHRTFPSRPASASASGGRRAKR